MVDAKQKDLSVGIVRESPFVFESLSLLRGFANVLVRIYKKRELYSDNDSTYESLYSIIRDTHTHA